MTPYDIPAHNLIEGWRSRSNNETARSNSSAEQETGIVISYGFPSSSARILMVRFSLSAATAIKALIRAVMAAPPVSMIATRVVVSRLRNPLLSFRNSRVCGCCRGNVRSIVPNTIRPFAAPGDDLLPTNFSADVAATISHWLLADLRTGSGRLQRVMTPVGSMLLSPTYGRPRRGVAKGLMVDDDRWKEELAFVSGYILVFGFAVLKLWPIAAGFQTGLNVNFWTVNLPSRGVATALWVFWGLTAALGIALTAIALAIGHILSRGLWLAFFSGSSTNPFVVGVGRLLDQSCRVIYRAAFFLLFYGGCLAVLEYCRVA